MQEICNNEKAIDSNLQNDDALRLLKKFVVELLDKGILVSKEQIIEKNIVIVDEKIADLSFESGEFKDAYTHYIDAFDYYCKQVILEKNESYQEGFERVGHKIIRVVIDADGKDDLNKGNSINPVLPLLSLQQLTIIILLVKRRRLRFCLNLFYLMQVQP